MKTESSHGWEPVRACVAAPQSLLCGADSRVRTGSYLQEFNPVDGGGFGVSYLTPPSTIDQTAHNRILDGLFAWQLGWSCTTAGSVQKAWLRVYVSICFGSIDCYSRHDLSHGRRISFMCPYSTYLEFLGSLVILGWQPAGPPKTGG